jgi:hypothetical protein
MLIKVLEAPLSFSALIWMPLFGWMPMESGMYERSLWKMMRSSGNLGISSFGMIVVDVVMIWRGVVGDCWKGLR